MKRHIAAVFVAIAGSLAGTEKPPIVLRELAHLVSIEAKSEGDGKVVITPLEKDPRVLKLSADLVIRSIDGAKGLAEVPLFVQGALVSISGTTCLPLKGEKMRIQNNIDAQGSMQIVDSKVIFIGPVKVRGDGFLVINKEAKIIELTGDDKAPLTFKLSLEGFTYVSGKGKILMPNGTAQSFPKD